MTARSPAGHPGGYLVGRLVRARAAQLCRRAVWTMLSLTFADRRVSTFRRAPLLAARRFSGTLSVAEVKRDPQFACAPAGRLRRTIGPRLEVGRKGLAIRTLYCRRVICRAPDPRRPWPCRFQTDRCSSRNGRTGGVRHRPAGRAEHLRSPIAACLAGRAPAIRGRMDAADALARLAKASGLKLKKVGANSYVLLPRNPDRPADGRTTETKAEGSDNRRASEEPEGRSQGHCRHGQQARYFVAALRRPMVADRWRRICAARRTRHRGDRSAIGRLFVDAPRRGPQQAVHSRHRQFKLQRTDPVAGRTVFRRHPDRRTAVPIPTSSWSTWIRSKSSKGPRGRSTDRAHLGGIVLLKPNMPQLRTACRAWHRSAARRPGMATSATTCRESSMPRSAKILHSVLVGYHAREGGYIDNLATGEKDINDVEITGGRATFSAELVPGWFVDVSGIAQRIDGDDSQYADEDGSGLSRGQPGRPAVLVRLHPGQPGHSQGHGRDPLPFDDRRQLAGCRRDFRCVDGRPDPPASTSAARRARRQQRDAPVAADGGRVQLAGRLQPRSTIAMKCRSRHHGEKVSVDLAGVENKVRETTIYGEAGFELLPGSKRASAPATPFHRFPVPANI